MLGHELRNPLGRHQQRDPPPRRRPRGRRPGRPRLRRHRAPGRATWRRLVDDLLDVGRVMTGQDRARARSRSIWPRSRAGRVATFRPPARSCTTGVDRRDRRPLWVNADAIRIEQIVGNLLTNAAQVHARRRHDPRQRRARGPARPCCACEDTGIGIAARAAAAHLRSVRPGRARPRSRAGRPGHRPHARAAARGAARRIGRGLQRRRRAAAAASRPPARHATAARQGRRATARPARRRGPDARRDPHRRGQPGLPRDAALRPRERRATRCTRRRTVPRAWTRRCGCSPTSRSSTSGCRDLDGYEVARRIRGAVRPRAA